MHKAKIGGSNSLVSLDIFHTPQILQLTSSFFSHNTVQDFIRNGIGMVGKGGRYEPRVRKRKARARLAAGQQEDPKAIIGINGEKVTGKKAKRLAKYMEKGLKEDENRALKKHLARNVVDTGLFLSSKNLGQTKMTKKQQIRQAAMQEERGIVDEKVKEKIRQVEVGGKSRKGWEVVREVVGADEAAGESENESENKAACPKKQQESENQMRLESGSPDSESGPEPSAPAPNSRPAARITPVLGGGLKRPLDTDEDGRPVIQKRQKRAGIRSKSWIHQSVQPYQLETGHTEEERSQASSSDHDTERNGRQSENYQLEADRKDIEEPWTGFNDDENEKEAGYDTGEADTDIRVESSADQDNSGSENDDEGNEDPGSDEESQEEISSKDENSHPSNSGAPKETRQAGSNEFLEWAKEQRNAALAYTPIELGRLQIPRPDHFQPRPIEQDPLPKELQPTKNDDRKAFSVPVKRLPAIQESRLKLPVVSEEQKIMEAIHNHDVVVVCGSTGSGKTTQVPQFLYEAGYGTPCSPTPGMIGITQPRRLATVSMSKRVAEELGDKGGVVAYQIRFQATIKDGTAIKFMTDGVLFRELSQDAFLSKYSAIIIDEAHERSLNTDILLGLLSELVRYRGKPKYGLPPLKLIIMSATLRIPDLTENPRLFKTPPPVLDVEGKQYPVAIHFSGITKHDYVREAFNKIKIGHKKLPPGAMLVFLTSQNEIYRLQKLLKAEFGGATISKPSATPVSTSQMGLEAEDIDFGNAYDFTEDTSQGGYKNGTEDDEDEDDEEEDDSKEFDIDEEGDDKGRPIPHKMHALPLYSMLPIAEQERVFRPPPPNSRLVVLSTNVAETSLTIPGIRYVFDCGRCKERHFHKETGVQSFDIGWISKASAAQRAGRAGRMGPGHCYRLYSSAVYERDFAEFAEPEILRVPIEGVVLELKARGRIKLDRFPFPTPPEVAAIAKAEKLLSYLLALDDDGKATRVGETMSIFPLAPRFSRILISRDAEGCLPYVIAVVAGLSAGGEIFIPENRVIPKTFPEEQESEYVEEEAEDASRKLKGPASQHDGHSGAALSRAESQKRHRLRKQYGRMLSKFTAFGETDLAVFMHAVLEFSHTPTHAWCAEHFVHHKTLSEVRQLRRQLTQLLAANIPEYSVGAGKNKLEWQDVIEPPNEKQRALIMQMVAAGFVDQVAIRADLHPTPPDVRKAKRAIDVAYVPLQPLAAEDGRNATGKTSSDEEKCVYIHPSSPMSRLSVPECPEYIIYRALQRPGNFASSRGSSSRKRMLPLTDITARQLGALARDTPLLQWGKPVKEIRTDGSGLVREGWFAPEMKVPGVSMVAWPLPMMRVRQRKVGGKGWVIIPAWEERGK